MVNNLTISLISEYQEHFPAVKKYLENQGFGIIETTVKEIEKTVDTDLSILFIDKISDDIIVFVESNLKNKPIIINYNYCPKEISIESFSKDLTFHYKQELNILPALIENAILKKKLEISQSNNYENNSTFIELIDRVLSTNIDDVHLDELVENSLTDISKYAGANDFQFFVLSKFKNFYVGSKPDFATKYDIKKLEEYYPEIKYDTFVKALAKNQELILFNKSENDLMTYHCLIVVPFFIKNTLYGCIIFNYHEANDNISNRQKEVQYLSKIFFLLIQNKIIYNQYENSISQFSRLINDAVNGIYQSTEEGRIIYANPAFLKIVGFDSLDELKKINLFTDLYSSKSGRENFIKKIKKEKTVHNYESELKKKSGEIINILENSRIIKRQDGSIFFEGIVQDITHQINLKERLKYQTSFSEKIIENASFLIFAVNESNEVILWNSMAEKISGYDRNELYTDSGLIKNIVANVGSLSEHFSKIISNEKSEYNLQHDEFELLAKDGSKKIISWSWTVNEYLGENTKQVIGFGIDVTETMKLEEQLFESQKMESIGTLAAGMAYDFTSIFNELNVYNSSLKSLIKPESKESTYVDRIEDTINKASTLSSKLIGLSKREEKKNVEVDVNTCVNYVLDLLEHTVNENVDLDKEVCNSPIIKGDISQIHQVLLNIAINANESISRTGNILFKTEIVLTKSDEYLHSVKTDEANFVKISISDNGNGIPSELQQRIFDPFFTTKTTEKGAGLGLSVAYNIVKNHNGYIFVESELDKGSNFYIYFPFFGKVSNDIAKSIDSQEIKKAKPKVIKKKNPQILVVDDEVIIRDLLNDVLIDQKYDILLAKDGSEGLELYTKHQKSIDLVLLDIIMPGMSGKEVFEKIREMDSNAKVIITSGYSKQQITESLMASGANGFLPKPFNIDKLLGLIKALVEEN